MKPSEWMVKPTPQTEWIRGRGILLWLAFFFIELGAGTFFVGTFVNNLPAMVIGWILCGVIGGGVHILYLGHPFRFWRMVSRPSSSWISRGLMFVALFLGLGLVQIALVMGGGTAPMLLVILVDLFAFLAIIYGGFAMNYVNGIPLWNTALLPVLYGISGIWGGAGLALGIALSTGVGSTLGVALEEWVRILLIAYIVLLAVYFISVRYTNITGKLSIQRLVSGEYWPLMWFVVVLLGLVFPATVVIISLNTGIENMTSILYATIFCELLGDITMRYLILKDGLYSPLIPSAAYPTV
ncbi:MAG: dimethyl sulfoxide reductase anchor subunit [Dehalococcoidales bacterium]|jgi:formate-dependent nitrite reductase membrane component NrfD|nr:dimethyl sulfoxide reductase anchor subunit [Dehalococcoidales bacterium]MDP6633027.1 dimethyl sulfoxide reductase anchor subunit [Dehalococcoidales bacterium]